MKMERITSKQTPHIKEEGFSLRNKLLFKSTSVAKKLRFKLSPSIFVLVFLKQNEQKIKATFKETRGKKQNLGYRKEIGGAVYTEHVT